MPLNILVNGAGVAGPTIATFLLRSNPKYTITIVERAPSLRTGGQQIDLRAQGIPIMRKLGLLETVKSKTVAEAGLAFVDSNGKEKAMFGVNDSGQGQQALTSEYEIMRGDLVEVLTEASKDAAKNAEVGGGRLSYEFGKYATEIAQEGENAAVTFSDGSKGTYDLVIGADGQGSRTRRIVFGEEEGNAAFKPFGLFVSYYSIPKGEGDNEIAKCYHMTDYRLIATRTGDRPVTQAYLGTLSGGDKIQESLKQPIEKQKEVWRKLFEDDSGWQTQRILAGLEKTEDFYAQPVGQVKLDHWSKGRVVLLGDAGYCPSPITGMGTTASLVGAYVLAGELARHEGDVPTALKGYEDVLRPFVNEAQSVSPTFLKFAYPKTQWGITFMHTVLGFASWLQIDKLVNRLKPEGKGGWQLPEYPELNLDE